MLIFELLSISFSCLIGCLGANQLTYPANPSNAVAVPEISTQLPELNIESPSSIIPGARNLRMAPPPPPPDFGQSCTTTVDSVFDISSPAAIFAVLVCLLCIAVSCASGIALFMCWYFLLKYKMRFREIEKEVIKFRISEKLSFQHFKRRGTQESLEGLKQRGSMSSAVRPPSPVRYQTIPGYGPNLPNRNTIKRSTVLESIPDYTKNAAGSGAYEIEDLYDTNGAYEIEHINDVPEGPYTLMGRRSQLDPLPIPEMKPNNAIAMLQQQSNHVMPCDLKEEPYLTILPERSSVCIDNFELYVPKP